MYYFSYGLVIVVTALIATVVSGFVYKRRLVKTISIMASGASRIGRGDFQYKLALKKNDELQELANSFNSMGDSLEAFVRDLQKRNKNLTTERQKQDSILSSVSDGIIAVNRNHEIRLANAPAAALIGKTPEDITGTPLQAAFPFLRANQSFILDTSKAGSFHYDNLVLRDGDKELFLELSVAVAPPTSEITAILTVHDVTASRELEIMKLDFVAIAAHELRTPLTVVRGYLDLIINSPEIAKLTVMNIEYLQRTKSGVTQLAELINNILNVSRIERNSLQIALAKIDLALVLKQATDQQRVTAELRHQKLTYERPPEKVFVVADASAITEVVNNLVSNAIKYTPENGSVTVRLTQDGDFARVADIENGRCIPEASKPRLFTKFYRVENSLTTGNRGTGRGLYICKSIVELHHGMIDVMSKLGAGSTFYFTLPLYDHEKHVELTAQTKELGGIHGWFPKRTHR
jgi:two-component system sensor histidine kinase VicK